MVKKEFTRQLLKKLNDLSDVELIEELDAGTMGSGEYYQNVIKGLLDKRLKTAIQDLTENIKKGNKTTKKYSERLFVLTIVLIILTAIIILLTGALVYYAKIQIWPIIEQQAENKRRALNYCEFCQGPDCKWPRIDGTMMNCSEVLESLKSN